MNPLEALHAWRSFATSVEVVWRGRRRSWAQHIGGSGYADEEGLIQPTVFPRFARRLLGFTVNENLAPERHGDEGKPDFTPADAVTHPWVFETKPTHEGVDLSGHESQVARYLRDGRPRIKRVVLTNLVGLRVMTLDDEDQVVEQSRVNLLGLLSGDEKIVSGVPDAQRLADFLNDFRFVELSPADKLDRVREAPPWTPVTAVTDSAYVSARLDQVVTALERDVAASIEALNDPARVTPEEVDAIVDELQFLAWRLGDRDDTRSTLNQFLRTPEGTVKAKALRQYRFHVAYYTATRLTLVRTWEDLGLLVPMLYDGGFNDVMKRFQGIVTDVVRFSFGRAKDRYRALFDQKNTYTWYEPSPQAYAEAIYELANTYFGDIRSDVLGEVYERLLERIDRKVLGQYYTPRDVIRLIWELMDIDVLAEGAEAEERAPRVLDIATGSGGFLVEASARLRGRLEGQLAAGASIDPQVWVNRVVDGLNGVEVQRFPAYLAELNLLIQFGQALREGQTLRVPPLGVIYDDTLALHNPDRLLESEAVAERPSPIFEARGREHRRQRLIEALGMDYLMDAVCGNPPYIGEKSAAPMLRRTRERHPYWNQYVGQHMDYLYWFLILGVSKLREGGRFGFITTEYWLRAAGARPLRRYLAQRCHIERLLLFRDMRLFPDAPGQHSLVIVGQRVVPPDGLPRQDTPSEARPTVSVYEGPNVRGPARASALSAMLDARTAARVRTFRAGRSPNALLGHSWSEVAMPRAKVRRRAALRATAEPFDVDPEEGILTGADRMRSGYDEPLTQQTLRQIGWPQRKAGIYVLQSEELGALGALNAKEKQLLRPVVNTKDVHPYAAVPPNPGSVLLYMAAPPRDSSLSDSQLRELPFPDGMPRIEEHLTQFRGLLARKVNSYNERRPWWSIHRPRPEIAARDVGTGDWADYCVAARWGSGQRLVVGMAPARSAPVSGINAMLTRRGVPGAFVCGLMNTTVVQELAETLPPGNVRAQDIRELGLPFLPHLVEPVSEVTIRLADLVVEMVSVDAPRFPALPMALREDMSLADTPDRAWLPEVGPATAWGTLSTVRWTESVAVRGQWSERIEDIEVSESLLGLHVDVSGARGGRAVIQLSDDVTARLGPLVEAYLWGHASVGGGVGEIRDLPAPVASEKLELAYRRDVAALHYRVNSYRALRHEIDGLVEDAL